MMEGINWGGVTEQANSIEVKLGLFNRAIQDDFQSFANELSYYWASGNAVTFGDNLGNSLEEFRTNVNNVQKEVAELINRAAQIYADRFNVPNEIGRVSPDPVTDIMKKFENPFKETVNGVTGMNKGPVTDCCNFYNDKIKKLIESAKTEVTGVELPIFDTAYAQRDAFKAKVEDLYSGLQDTLEHTIAVINRDKKKEEDRVELAKRQTVNTFNA